MNKLRKTMEPDVVFIEFECERCQKNTDICSISEVVYDGAPMCVDCSEEMSIVECYIEES